MPLLNTIQLGPDEWALMGVAAAYLLVVFVASVFSLQVSMAYFGEEIPTYRGTAVLKLKLIAAVGGTLLVGYAFLGPLAFLSAPAAFLVVLAMIAKSAKSDRFSGAIITLSHTAATGIAAGLCGFVAWVGLSTFGVDVRATAADVYAAGSGTPRYGSYASDDEISSNVSHSNPFVETSISTPTGTAEQEHSDQTH